MRKMECFAGAGWGDLKQFYHEKWGGREGGEEKGNYSSKDEKRGEVPWGTLTT